MSTLSIIVAMSENRVIGRGGDLPWHISEDLKRFKRITTDHTIIMGRRTYESIGRPLPRRRSIVISRNPEYKVEGAEVVHNFEAALRATEGEDEVFVIGGSSIYQLALPGADRLYITRVHAQVDGDTFFPLFHEDRWGLIDDVRHAASDKTGPDFSFQVYDRTDEAKA